jgi:hypothetical protein
MFRTPDLLSERKWIASCAVGAFEMIRSDSGSTFPLAIGITALSLALSMFWLESIGIQLQRLQLKNLSDTLVLEVARELKADGIAPLVGLDYSPVTKIQLDDGRRFLKLDITRSQILSFDGRTIDGHLCSRWKSITGFSFGNNAEVCVITKARAIS